MLTVGETQWEIYMDSLYFLCNVYNLKLFWNKSFIFEKNYMHVDRSILKKKKKKHHS